VWCAANVIIATEEHANIRILNKRSFGKDWEKLFHLHLQIIEPRNWTAVIELYEELGKLVEQKLLTPNMLKILVTELIDTFELLQFVTELGFSSGDWNWFQGTLADSIIKLVEAGQSSDLTTHSTPSPIGPHTVA
jgi:hypothetical protein